jgi:hypothetical protein
MTYWPLAIVPTALEHLIRGGEKEEEEGEVALGLAVVVIVRLVESEAREDGMAGMGCDLILC